MLATSARIRRVARHGAQNAEENWTSVALSPSACPSWPLVNTSLAGSAFVSSTPRLVSTLRRTARGPCILPLRRRQVPPPISAIASAAASATIPGVMAANSAVTGPGIPDLGHGNADQHVAAARDLETMHRASRQP